MLDYGLSQPSSSETVLTNIFCPSYAYNFYDCQYEVTNDTECTDHSNDLFIQCLPGNM